MTTVASRAYKLSSFLRVDQLCVALVWVLYYTELEGEGVTLTSGSSGSSLGCGINSVVAYLPRPNLIRLPFPVVEVLYVVYEVFSWDRFDLEVDGLLESTITTLSVVSGPSRVNEDSRSEDGLDGLAGFVGAGIVTWSGGDMPSGWGAGIVSFGVVSFGFVSFCFVVGNMFSVEAVIPIGMAADVAEVHLARSLLSKVSCSLSSSVLTSSVP
jgi:hypothetical protein